VKGFKGYVGFVALALCSANVCADLPQSSILSRYGVTTDQLPSPPKTEAVEPVEEKSRVKIQPQKTVVNQRRGGGKQPQTTGNLSIDRMAQQDLDRCRRLQGEVVKRGGTYMPCDGSLPGMPTFE
jgi:hypothetical protein